MRGWLVLFFQMIVLLLTAAPLSQAAKKPTCKVFPEQTVRRPAIAAADQNLIQLREFSVLQLVEAYSTRLGPFQDAFATAWTLHHGNEVFQNMSVRSVNGQWVHSPLAVINSYIKQFYVDVVSYNDELLAWIIQDASELLRTPNTETIDLQSNLLALKFTLDYLRRFKLVEVSTAVTATQDEKSKKADTPQKKKEPEKKNTPPQSPPEYPELPKAYQPSTKDVDKSDSNQDKHKIVEFNFAAPLVGQRIYAEIVRHADFPVREIDLPTTLSAPGPFAPTKHMMRFYPTKSLNYSLYVPSGYRPLQPADPGATIRRLGSGAYEINLKEQLAEVQIPLVIEDNILMLPHILEIYTRPVGVNYEEWPAKIRNEVFSKFDAASVRQNPLALARAIEQHINNEYLYTDDERPELDLIDALKAGVYQCSMGAYIMVAALRDIYQIPTRIIGGFRAKRLKSGSKNESYLLIPGRPHMWVEVFYNGRWYAFDPTPVKKDRTDENKQNEEIDLFEDVPMPDHTPAADPGDVHDNSNPSSVEKKAEGTPVPENIVPMSTEELASLLTIGSLSMSDDTQKSINPLQERIGRLLLQYALDPTRESLETQNILNLLANTFQLFSAFPEVKRHFDEAKAVHAKAHPTLNLWLGQTISELEKQDVHKTYDDIRTMIRAIELYGQVLDRQGRVPFPTELLAILKKILDELQTLAHPNAQDIGIVRELVKDLPMVVNETLRRDHGLVTVGPNIPTQNLADVMRAGSLSDLRLLAHMLPNSDFIVNTTPSPEFMPMRTWIRDPRQRVGRDLMPAQRLSESNRAILGQPNLSFIDNFRQGTAWVQTRRQRVLIPEGRGIEEAERATLILCDISKSMFGNPASVQAALTGAFTARGLSDISPSGKQRHRIIILLFDTSIKKIIPVTTVEQATDVIRNYKKELTPSGDGTDIQAVLLEAFAVIADAEKRAGEPLAAANIFLMSDGGAKVDLTKLLAARNTKFSARTPLQILFAAINGTNEDLKTLSQESQKTGIATKGHYREFTSDDIAKAIAFAESTDFSGKDHFFTEAKPAQIPSNVTMLLRDAAYWAGRWSEQIRLSYLVRTPQQHYETLETLQAPRYKELSRPLETWLIQTRNVLGTKPFADQNLRHFVVHDLISNFQRITRSSTDSLSQLELEHLRHLLRDAARK